MKYDYIRRKLQEVLCKRRTLNTMSKSRLVFLSQDGVQDFQALGLAIGLGISLGITVILLVLLLLTRIYIVLESLDKDDRSRDYSGYYTPYSLSALQKYHRKPYPLYWPVGNRGYLTNPL